MGKRKLVVSFPPINESQKEYIQLVVDVKKGAGDRSLFYIVLDKLTCISYHEANKH